jgi:gamma-glutamyltranspeptidase/glutathione hydrolase
VRINYKGIDVFECPPNSQGFVMLQALNILEGMNVRYMRHNSAPYLHAVTESLKLAFADRNKYVGRSEVHAEHPDARDAVEGIRGDPPRADRSGQGDRGEAPFGNPASATERHGGRHAALPPASPTDTQVITGEENGHTTYLAVVDKDRNMVSVTSSLLSVFGSGHVVKGAGFVLNNRMAYYGLDETTSTC